MRARSRTHCTADLCVTAGYTTSSSSSSSSSSHHLLLLVPGPSGPLWRGLSALPSRVPQERRAEEPERSSRVSQSRRRWTHLCALIKYYARLTECRVPGSDAILAYKISFDRERTPFILCRIFISLSIHSFYTDYLCIFVTIVLIPTFSFYKVLYIYIILCNMQYYLSPLYFLFIIVLLSIFNYIHLYNINTII